VGVDAEGNGAQVSAQLAHSLAGVVRAKYHDLGRLYWGLAGMVIMACALLVVLTVFGLTA
jgi:hypothetical protein